MSVKDLGPYVMVITIVVCILMGVEVVMKNSRKTIQEPVIITVTDLSGKQVCRTTGVLLKYSDGRVVLRSPEGYPMRDER